MLITGNVVGYCCVIDNYAIYMTMFLTVYQILFVIYLLILLDNYGLSTRKSHMFNCIIVHLSVCECIIIYFLLSSAQPLEPLQSYQMSCGVILKANIGNCQQLLAIVGYCWLLLVIVGHCWLLLVIIGYCGLFQQLLAIVGYCWLLLAIVGNCWQLLAIVGYCWLLLAIVVYCWLLLIIVLNSLWFFYIFHVLVYIKNSEVHFNQILLTANLSCADFSVITRLFLVMLKFFHVNLK